MLTMKQEKFILNIAKGMSQRDAYKDAYNTKRMSDNAIDREASLLMKNPKLTQRLRELADAMAKPTIMTAQERLEYLTEVIKGTKGEQIIEVIDGVPKEITIPASIKNRLNAIDIMNKMQGEYTTKIEADVKNEVTINIELSDD
jgi:phage terminase small subunit